MEIFQNPFIENPPPSDQGGLTLAAKLGKVTEFLRKQNKTPELRHVLLRDLQCPERQGDSAKLTIAPADQKNYMALFDDLKNPESSPMSLGEDLRAALRQFFLTNQSKFLDEGIKNQIDYLIPTATAVKEPPTGGGGDIVIALPVDEEMILEQSSAMGGGGVVQGFADLTVPQPSQFEQGYGLNTLAKRLDTTTAINITMREAIQLICAFIKPKTIQTKRVLDFLKKQKNDEYANYFPKDRKAEDKATVERILKKISGNLSSDSLYVHEKNLIRYFYNQLKQNNDDSTYTELQSDIITEFLQKNFASVLPELQELPESSQGQLVKTSEPAKGGTKITKWQQLALCHPMATLLTKCESFGGINTQSFIEGLFTNMPDSKDSSLEDPTLKKETASVSTASLSEITGDDIKAFLELQDDSFFEKTLGVKRNGCTYNPEEKTLANVGSKTDTKTVLSFLIELAIRKKDATLLEYVIDKQIEINDKASKRKASKDKSPIDFSIFNKPTGIKRVEQSSNNTSEFKLIDFLVDFKEFNTLCLKYLDSQKGSEFEARAKSEMLDQFYTAVKNGDADIAEKLLELWNTDGVALSPEYLFSDILEMDGGSKLLTTLIGKIKPEDKSNIYYAANIQLAMGFAIQQDNEDLFRQLLNDYLNLDAKFQVVVLKKCLINASSKNSRCSIKLLDLLMFANNQKYFDIVFNEIESRENFKEIVAQTLYNRVNYQSRINPEFLNLFTTKIESEFSSDPSAPPLPNQYLDLPSAPPMPHALLPPVPPEAPPVLASPPPEYYFDRLLNVDDIDINQLFDREGVFLEDLPWKDEPDDWRNGGYCRYQESLLGAIIRLGHSDLLQQLVTRPNLDTTKACTITTASRENPKVFDASEELINRIAYLNDVRNIRALKHNPDGTYDENAKNIVIKECFSILLDKHMVDFNKVISRMYELYAFMDRDKLENLGNPTNGIDSSLFFATNESRHYEVMRAETKDRLASLNIKLANYSGVLPIELSLFDDFDPGFNPFPTEDALINLIGKIRPFKLGKLLALKNVTFTATMIEKTLNWYLDEKNYFSADRKKYEASVQFQMAQILNHTTVDPLFELDGKKLFDIIYDLNDNYLLKALVEKNNLSAPFLTYLLDYLKTKDPNQFKPIDAYLIDVIIESTNNDLLTELHTELHNVNSLGETLFMKACRAGEADIFKKLMILKHRLDSTAESPIVVETNQTYTVNEEFLNKKNNDEDSILELAIKGKTVDHNAILNILFSANKDKINDDLLEQLFTLAMAVKNRPAVGFLLNDPRLKNTDSMVKIMQLLLFDDPSTPNLEV
ncbi:MAG: hypothetical protein VW397_05960 [Candidatus Margulisiibacteriota bacterium]